MSQILKGGKDQDYAYFLARINLNTFDTSPEKVLRQKIFNVEYFKTDLISPSWVAPVRGAPHLALIRSVDKISVYNFNTKSIVSESTDGWVVEKYSKDKDSHLILVPRYSSVVNIRTTSDERRIYYVENESIKYRSLKQSYPTILSSYLDLVKQNWSITVNKTVSYSLFNDVNQVDTDRMFYKFRFSDMLAQKSMSIPDKAQTQFTENFVFNLFPSELGYAERQDLETEEIKPLKLFNLKEIK